MHDGLTFLGEGSDGEAIAGRSLRATAAAAYRRGDYLTATPRRLAELLYDAAAGLCERALSALDEGQFELAADRLARARRIFRQIQGCLEPTSGRTARRLWGLCEDVHRRLLEADHYRRREALAETLLILAYQRPQLADLTPSGCQPPAGHDARRALPDWTG